MRPKISISADGRFVAFSSEASNLVPDDSKSVSDIFVGDLGPSDPSPQVASGREGCLHATAEILDGTVSGGCNSCTSRQPLADCLEVKPCFIPADR